MTETHSKFKPPADAHTIRSRLGESRRRIRAYRRHPSAPNYRRMKKAIKRYRNARDYLVAVVMDHDDGTSFSVGLRMTMDAPTKAAADFADNEGRVVGSGWEVT
jgi:hypothetical protein